MEAVSVFIARVAWTRVESGSLEKVFSTECWTIVLTSFVVVAALAVAFF